MLTKRHITIPKGFLAAGVKCGIKASGREDLAVLAAGCDVVLHCNGELAEMEAVAGACGSIDEAAAARFARGAAMRRSTGSFDSREAVARRDALLGESGSP